MKTAERTTAFVPAFFTYQCGEDDEGQQGDCLIDCLGHGKIKGPCQTAESDGRLNGT
jgi:hypothetical protein